MSKADSFIDQKILIDAIEIQKTTNSEYINSINQCTTKNVVTELQLILSEELEILSKLKTEALKRDMIKTIKTKQDDINNGQNQLEPGVKFVHKAAARKMLADGDVSQHSDTPPFRLCSRGRTRLSPASRRCLASRIILTA